MARGLDDRLGRWTAAGVISAGQAAAITELERGQRPLHPLAEAGAYGGAVLVLAAATALVSRFWGALTVPAQAGLLASVAALLLTAGWWVDGAGPGDDGGGGGDLDSPEDTGGPVRRLVGFLWTGAAIAATGVVAVLGESRLDDEVLAVAIGGTAAAVAGGLWARRHGVLLLVSAWLGVDGAVGAGLALADVEPTPVAAALYMVGVVGGLLVWGGVLTPRRTGWTLAALSVLLSSEVVVFDLEAPGLVLAVATAVALCALGATLREFVLLGFGLAGIAVFVPQTFDDLGVDQVGAAALTLVVGLAVLVGGLMAVRRGQGGGSDAPAGGRP